MSASRAWTPRASGCASTPRWGSPITRSASRTCGPCTTRCVPSCRRSTVKPPSSFIPTSAKCGADPDGLPHRCRVQETAAQEEGRALRQPFAAAARRPPVLARSSHAGALRAPYRAVAEPRTLFRPACEPLEMAAFAAVDDLRRPLYPELCAALPGADARKMREPA